MARAYTAVGNSITYVSQVKDPDTGDMIEAVTTVPMHPDNADYIGYLAQKALADTDYVAARCLEAGIEYPAEWRQWRNAVRDIVRDPQPNAQIPVQPAKPSW